MIVPTPGWITISTSLFDVDAPVLASANAARSVVQLTGAEVQEPAASPFVVTVIVTVAAAAGSTPTTASDPAASITPARTPPSLRMAETLHGAGRGESTADGT